MCNPRYRSPYDHPKTLGEFVRLDWSMRWSCSRCNLTDVRKADMGAAAGIYGPHYPTTQFMGEMFCRTCGSKIGVLTESREDRAETRKTDSRVASFVWRRFEIADLPTPMLACEPETKVKKPKSEKPKRPEPEKPGDLL